MFCPFCGKSQFPQNPDKQFVNGEPDEITHVKLAFDSGRVYDVPKILPHVIIAHEYQPPTAFVGDVMNSRCIPVDHLHPAIIANALALEIDHAMMVGSVPDAMPYRLFRYLQEV